MAVVGIICEYNPLHIGHQRQFRLIRERFGPDTPVVCLMSGNFVQRGEPAVFDKFVRARAAVLCGANLVLELPLTGALASAEPFARCGVETLHRLGVVDTLCFGSEHGGTEALQRTARVLLLPEFGARLRQALDRGISFASARAEAAARLGGDETLLRRPNDILAVEYCKALEQLQSPIRPLAVERPGGYHDDEPDPQHPSAASLRGRMERGGEWRSFVPPEAAAVFDGAQRYAYACGERAMLARLRALSDEEFAALPYGSEGLWNRVRKACRQEPSVEVILQAAKSKRYAYSRLKRMLLCAFLGLTAEDLRRPVPYVRVLAFDDRGRSLLRRARDGGGIPVVQAGAVPPDRAYYRLECRASDLFSLFAEGVPGGCGMEAAGRAFYRKMDVTANAGVHGPADGTEI